MRRDVSLFLASVAVGCLLTPGAPSQAAAQAASGSFSTSDLDKNGKIDRAEYQRRMVEVFYFADRNKDGVVTIEEIVAIEPLDDKAFKAADRDGSGTLTVNEFVAYRMIQFDEADRNKDGVLTVEEVEVWEKR